MFSWLYVCVIHVVWFYVPLVLCCLGSMCLVIGVVDSMCCWFRCVWFYVCVVPCVCWFYVFGPTCY